MLRPRCVDGLKGASLSLAEGPPAADRRQGCSRVGFTPGAPGLLRMGGCAPSSAKSGWEANKKTKKAARVA